MKQEFITVGTVVNAHGIHGEVKLNPVGFDAEFVASFDRLYLDGRETQVLAARVHKSTVLLTLPGVTDMDGALALKGKSAAIRRTDANLPEGDYFDAEMEGCIVVDDDTGAQVGRITRVLHYPAHKVYEVVGQRTYLIPAVPEVFIRSVDMASGVVRAYMMKGLAVDEN